jgi:hypothetical protein
MRTHNNGDLAADMMEDVFGALEEALTKVQALQEDKEDLMYAERNANVDVVKYKEQADQLGKRLKEKDDLIEVLKLQLHYFQSFFSGGFKSLGEDGKAAMLKVQKQKEEMEQAILQVRQEKEAIFKLKEEKEKEDRATRETNSVMKDRTATDHGEGGITAEHSIDVDMDL